MWENLAFLHSYLSARCLPVTHEHPCHADRDDQDGIERPDANLLPHSVGAILDELCISA